MPGKKNQFELSDLQMQFARYITVKAGLTFSKAAALPLRDGGLPFGPIREALYKYVHHTTIEALRKSYKSFQKPSAESNSEWKPLSRDYDPTDWLKPHQLLHPLTEKEYISQAVQPTSRAPQKTTIRPQSNTMPPKTTKKSSSSSASATSRADSIVKTDGDAGHAYIVGTLEDFANLDLEAADELYEEAKRVCFGQNESLLRIWISHLGSVKIETNDANTEAIALTIWGVDLRQYKMYKLAYGGPNREHLLLQVPTLTDDVGDSFGDTLGTLQVKTTNVVERERNDSYAKLYNKLEAEKTRVRHSLCLLLCNACHISPHVPTPSLS